MKKGRLGSTLYILFADHLYSRTLAECDDKETEFIEFAVNFYSRTLARCDPHFFARMFSAVFISTHAPLRGATLANIGEQPVLNISTHAPLRGATSKFCYDYYFSAFLLTHPCEVRRRTWLIPVRLYLISTHAPLRGATGAKGGLPFTAAISTHAPLRGATTDGMLDPYPCLISTHAPLRGATREAGLYLFGYEFLLTHPCEVRRWWRSIYEWLG